MRLLKFNFNSTPLVIFLLIISSNLYSQKRQYSINAGSNFTISTLSFEGKFGFYASGDVAFPLNNHLSLKTGIGIKQLSFSVSGSRTSEMIYFTGTNGQTLYNDREPFIIPGSVTQVGDSSYIENTQPLFIDSLHTYWGNSNYYPSNYFTLLFNIPIQLQVNLIKNKLLLTSGISVSSIIYAKNTINNKWGDPEASDYNNKSYTANKDFKSAFINANIGAKYKVFRNFYAGFEYERSITNISKIYNSLYLDSFSANLTYKFNK